MKIYCKHFSLKCSAFGIWFQRTVFYNLSILLVVYSLAGADILTNLSTISSDTSQFDIIFSEALLDQASLAYHFIFRTNDSSRLVLNISEFSVDDIGGAKILVAVENAYDENSQLSSSIDKRRQWKIHSWSGPCTGGALVTSNNTQLIEHTRFSLKGSVCAFQPCIPKKLAVASSCIPAQVQGYSTTPRAFHSLLQFSDCYYAFGGLSSVSPLDELPPFYALVSEESCGKVLLKDNQFPISRRYLASIVSASQSGTRIFVLGGVGPQFKAFTNGDGYISYNSSASSSISWFSMPSLQLFGHAACALFPNRIYAYGGSTFDGGISSSLLQWRQKWSAWRPVVAWYGSPPPPLFGHSLTCSSDSMKLYLYGGFSLTSTARLNSNPTVFIFDVIVKRWSTLVTIEPRFFHSAALLPAKYSGSEELANGAVILVIAGGKSSSNDVLLIDTRCQTVIKANSSGSFQQNARVGASTAVSSLQSEPYFKLLSSGGMQNTSIISAAPSDMGIKLPNVNRQCPKNSLKQSEIPVPYWRCGLALNPAVYFNSNTSRYFYDVYLPNRNDLTTFIDVDLLANTLSALTSPSVEWVVQCRGWLGLDSMTGLGLAAASTLDDGTIEKHDLNFRFAIYLFIDGNLVQSYQPSGKMTSPSLPLMDADDSSNRGNIGNGIFQVSVFLHGYGPIVPSGSNLQLQSTTTGATYLLPTSMLSATIAELACSSPSSQISCVVCLLNAACSWLPGSPGLCVARRLEMPTSEMGDNENGQGDVIRDPSACPSCFLHSSFCRDCTLSSDSCTWLPGLDICSPRPITEEIPEATMVCPTPCLSRRTCSACTDNREPSPRCLWCPERSLCVDYWLAEAGVPTAMGCTLGCPLAGSTLPTLPPPLPTTTICADDNSWCGTPNEVCVAMMAASLLDTTPSPLVNPVDAFPLMRDDDFLTNNSSPFDLLPLPPPELSMDPKMLFLSKFNMDPNSICSGHGHCIPPGRCQCDQFWQGDSCSKECRCYGDAKCPDPSRPDYCICPPGTTGPACERCLFGYTGNPKNGVACRTCSQACNNNADSCVSLNAVRQLNLTNVLPSIILAKKLPIAEQDSDLFCIGCRDHTMGNLCHSCMPGFFRPAFLGRIDLQAKCQSCMCNDHSNYCSEAGGFGCLCEDNTRTAYGVPNTLGCASCVPPFIGDPRNGRPCYLPVSQNQQLCLLQDAVPGLAAKLVAATNASDMSNLCRNSRDTILPPSTSMHLAAQVPLASELRVFVGIVTGTVDIVMTLNPTSLRPAPKRPNSRSSDNSSSRQKRAIVGPPKAIASNTYDNIVEVPQIRNVKRDPSGDSIVYISRTQLTGAPIAVRGVTGRFLIVISPPSDRLKQGDELDDSDSAATANQAIVFYMRITAVSAATIRAKNINDDVYYGVNSADPNALPTGGVVVFRQDQVQIDVFVFFSVFLALFVLLLLGLLLIIRFHAVLSERRRLRARQQRKRAMVRRPFGVSWPRFDLPLLLNYATKAPMKVSDLFLPVPPPPSIQQVQNVNNNNTRKTATVVSLQPTSNLRAAITTVLIKLPVTRPLQRQLTTASGFNVNEQTAIVTSVPPPPMAFGTLIMRVIVQEQKKAPSGRRARIVSPVKPGRQPLFDRDPTDESFVEEPYPPAVTPSPVNHNGPTIGSAVVPPIRLNTRSTSISRNTPSSVTLPPTPDSVISTREDGDDLDDIIDEIVGGSNPSSVARNVMHANRRPMFGATRGGAKGRPMAVMNRARAEVVANPTAQNQNSATNIVAQELGPSVTNILTINHPTRAKVTVAEPPVPPLPLSRDGTESTSLSLNVNEPIALTNRSDIDLSESVLIPELPENKFSRLKTGKIRRVFNQGTASISSRGRPSLVAGAVLAQRPPLPPSATRGGRLKTAIGRRQSVPGQSTKRVLLNAPNISSVHSEEDSVI